jgi:1-pyrroline-5-carboxylate dehydrogenase
VTGGNYDKSVGYFIEPTIIECKDPHSETMEKEIFGPVLSVFVYEDEKYDETLSLIDSTSEYALTGAFFALGRDVINYTSKRLENSSGNLYINDKSTGAVVGQQPFGGARSSGTNDKAGSEHILTRWVSMRSIKENFRDIKTWKYPSVDFE